MRILITGGTGFIGRNLCRRLEEKGHQRVVLSRQPPSRVQSLCGDVEAVTAFDQLRGPVDAVINLAGEPILGPRWSRARKQALWESRVTLTERLVAWMASREKPPALLVSASAVGYYGDQGDRELDEQSSPLGESFGSRLCRAWEEAARGAEGDGTRLCILRIGPVLGREGGMLPRMLPAFRLGLGGPLGKGDQWLAWIHLQDLLGIVLYLMERPELSGVFNATAPAPVTSREFARTLGRVLRRPAPLPAPALLLKLLLGEQAEVLLGSQRVVPRRLLEAGFEFRYPDLEAALTESAG